MGVEVLDGWVSRWRRCPNGRCVTEHLSDNLLYAAGRFVWNGRCGGGLGGC